MKLIQGLILGLILVASAAQAAEVLVLSDRNQDYFAKVFEGFTAKTGHTVALVNKPWADLKRDLSFGAEADVLLVKDLSFIVDAKKDGVFQKLSDANLNAGVPAFMRDAEGEWTAVSYRVRTLVYDPLQLTPSEIPTYESISKPEFAGRLCARNSKEYMPTMVAWLIAQYGEVKAKEIVSGWRSNLAMFTARDPETIDKVEDSTCAVGISNHYYYARAKAAEPRLSVEIAMTNADAGGIHTNGFGGGVLKTSSEVEAANALIAYILSPEGSALMIQAPSYEYPAVATNKAAELVEGFGAFTPSEVPWSDVYAQMAKAKEILEQVGWAKE